MNQHLFRRISALTYAFMIKFNVSLTLREYKYLPHAPVGKQHFPLTQPEPQDPQLLSHSKSGHGQSAVHFTF